MSTEAKGYSRSLRERWFARGWFARAFLEAGTAPREHSGSHRRVWIQAQQAGMRGRLAPEAYLKHPLSRRPFPVMRIAVVDSNVPSARPRPQRRGVSP